jgi:branched-chain amino acid transport system ATP-binding protein
MCELGLSRTFQNPRPFGRLSVFDNATVGGMVRGTSVSVARKRAQEALELVELWDRRSDLSEILPLGQLKRLEIARCLATQPRMLLLDEPIGGLHPAEIDELARFIRRLPDRGLTVVLIEHNMRVALNTCHRLVVLNFGKVIATGSGTEVSQDPEVIRAYLGDISDDELGLEVRRSGA